MDVSFIKKEEPVEYALISIHEEQGLSNEKTYNELHSMDIYTMNMKEEPTETDDSYNCNRFDHATIESEISDYNPESEVKYESLSENDTFEDRTINKVSSNSRSSKSHKKRKFECKKCFATFKKKFSLLDHMKRHNDQLNMDCCKICYKFFPKSILEFHVTLHNGPPYFCSICGKEFSSRGSFRGHKKIHREKEYQCEICHKFFISKALLSSHLEIHQEVREKTFQCHICKFSFFRKNTLLRHVRNLHSGIPRMKYKCSNTSCNREYVRNADLLRHKCRIKKQPKEKLKTFKCATCDISFDTLPERKQHVRRNHRNVVKEFYCHKCKKTFRGYDYFVLHSAQNCPDKIMYECDMCSRLIGGKPRLLSHFGNYHKISALRTVQCPQCDKKFTTKRILLFHLKVHEKLTTITKKNTYECRYCSRIFQIYSKCIDHMNKTCTLRKVFVDNSAHDIDSIRQTFKCHICGYTYTQKCAIIDHMKIMHSSDSISGVKFMKKFTCSMNQRIVRQYPCCDENFIGETLNQEHTVQETCTFPCRKCKKEYANLYSLLRHCAEHTSKVHQSLRHLQQCKACDRLFKWKRSMPEHLQSLEDRIKCMFCEKVFKFNAHYNNHKCAYYNKII